MEKFNLMMSINVRSMGITAKELKAHIEEELNAKVWICTDMAGGQNYRDEIVKAVDKAFAVILLVNNDWAESAECEDEYNYAKRLHLTSKHDPRRPFIIPIAFPDLDWQKRSHIRLLMSSTNAIMAKEAVSGSFWPNLKETLVSIGLSASIVDASGRIDFSKHLNKDAFTKLTKEQVLQWIDYVDIPDLKPHVEKNRINGADLVDISMEDLEDFGIPPFQRKKIMKLLSEYKQLPKDYYRGLINASDKIIGKETQISIGNKTVTLYQHTETTVFINLARTGGNENFSSYIVPVRKPWGASDSNVFTHFTKIRFDPQTMTVNIGDYTFASYTGNCNHHKDIGCTNRFPYATCFDCERDHSHSGKANINLQGTPFAVDDRFRHDGWNSAGTWDFSNNDQVVNLTGGGYCGWTCPVSCANEGEACKGGWSLKLKFAS